MATPYPSDTKYSMASASDVGQDIEKPPPYQFETPIQPQGYPPQNPPQQGYPPQTPPQQGYPPQTPPQQGYPPQTPPQQGYPPQQTQVSQQTVVVTQQPVATTTRVYHSDQTNHSGIATAALVLSIIAFFLCGGLICVLPAFLLAVTAQGQKGQKQRKNAQVSIGLSIAAIVTTVILIAVIVGINVTSSSYYY